MENSEKNQEKKLFVFKTNEDKCTALLEKKNSNSLRTQFTVVKLWGPWNEFDSDVKIGTNLWFGNLEVQEMRVEGILKEESEFQPLFPETEAKLPVPKEEPKKLPPLETNLFTPFKFTHTKETAFYFGKTLGSVDVGRIAKIQMIQDEEEKVKHVFVIHLFDRHTERGYSPFEIDEEKFSELKPIFYDDFDYLTRRAEQFPEAKKNDNDAAS
jgi:hypothetical protein